MSLPVDQELPARPAKLAAFDMDGTLLDGRLVYALANRFDLQAKVRKIQEDTAQGHQQTAAIAKLFEGIQVADLESAVKSIPLSKNAERTITSLKSVGYVTGIISDSYTIAADVVARTLGMDFVGANKLEVRNHKLTGRVFMPLGWEKIGCFCRISVCKRYHLERFATERGISISNTIAIGDTRSDICMIKTAGVGVAFMPKDGEIAKSTVNIIDDGDLYKILSFIT